MNSVNYSNTATFSGIRTGVVDMEIWSILGLFVPPGMLSSEIKFECSTSFSGTYVPIRNDANGDLSVDIGSDAAFYPLDPASFVGVRFIKFVADFDETGKVLTLATRRVE